MSNISLDFFQNGLYNSVKNICSDIKENDELEASFGSVKKPISLKKFNNILKYINIRGKNDKLSIIDTTTLDILYSYDQKTNSVYRLTIHDIDNINKFIREFETLKDKNHVIFSRNVIAFLNQEKSDKIQLINKIKSPKKFIALEEYDIRIKMSEEKSDIGQSELLKLESLKESETKFISYRFKQRKSLIIHNNDKFKISIDLTNVKSNRSIHLLSSSNSKYELEVDVSFKKSIEDNIIKEVLDKMALIIFDLERFLQQSTILVTKTESIQLIKAFNKLAYDDENESYKDLPGMQSASVEVQHVLDYIPGNYTITDKADGERYFLMIYENALYLLSNNLDVKKIKILQKNNHNLTVIDGEYLYLPQYRKCLYLSFDVLFSKGVDIRSTEQLKDRLKILNEIYTDIFNIETVIGDVSKEKLTDIKSIRKFHENNMINHLIQLNNKLGESSEDLIFNYKYFIFPTIGNQEEIYNLTALMYELYTSNTGKKKCPYVLDGIIYTPINQKYTRNQRDIKFKVLKWKPEKSNSIDFYVEYERNPDTKKISTVYDRTNDKSLEDYIDEKKTSSTSTDIDFTDMGEYTVNNSTYQILNLYVGKVKNNQETPVLFQKENDLSQAYIYVKDGYARDIEGNLIEDATVVEFSYNDDINIPEKFRWIPLRTRFDKTESVMMHKRKYGNNSEIANRVWNSIQNPIKFDDIKLLGDAETAKKQITLLKSKITSETISMSRRDDKYYQIITNLGKSLRNYHNWIKSNMIYTYCEKKTLLDSTKVSMDILDIGVGRGGDLMKLYHAKVKSSVGIDVNESGIFSGSDGAISRYNVMKKKMPGFPKMSFLVADAGQKLDFINQSSLGQMNDQTVKLLKQVFGENENSTKHSTFDVINAQFMIHYLFRNNLTWNNFCSNVSKYLRSDGYLLITTFDGELVDKTFKNGHIIREYISDDGQKKTLFDIVKKYPDNLDIKSLKSSDKNFGIQIDVHNPMFMNEGEYITEYLVNPSFLINELKSKCNMRLVETESFQNLYYVYQDFFVNTAEYESKLETRKFFDNVKEFYNLNDEVTKSLFEFSRLNRYYIFQKK